MAPRIATGMTVVGCDGTKIGTVKRFFSAEPEDREGDDMDAESTDSPDLDLEELEQVGEMPATYFTGPVGASASGTGEPARVPPVVEPADPDAPAFGLSDTKYMEIHHGGVLGIGGESIYVPYSAVDAISDDLITLRSTADDALARFSQPPAHMAEPT